jgi:hypothetical protein
MRVLVACEYSGRVRDAFRALGHSAYSCDLLDTETPTCDSLGYPAHFKGDVRALLYGKWDLMIAHPPCTYLTNSGVRWMNKERRRLMQLAANFYSDLWHAPIPQICIENPVMHGYGKAAVEKLIGKHKRQFVQPWYFGEPMFKRTGYLLKGLSPLVPTDMLVPPKDGTEEHKAWSWVHRCPPSPERWKIRSRTPIGIATAMAQQWGRHP